MARARETSTSDDDTTPDTAPPEPQAAAAKPDDVLCYVDRLGPMSFVYHDRSNSTRAGSVMIPSTVTVRIEPGLSFCPGERWPDVKAQQAWKQRVAMGACRSVAGHGGQPLMVEWAKVKTAALVAMLAKTFHIETLERLREMESRLEHPRLDVAQEIDARLAEMGQKVKDHQEKRRTARRGHRQKLG